jgi:hypothetical protein
MKRTLLLAVLALAGCGSASRYDAGDVESVFRANGLPLQRIPSRGAEQPAMGEISACATRFTATAAGGALAVSVCDDAKAAGSLSGDYLTRGNVAVEYSGHDERTQRRIAAALADLG